MNKDQPDPHPDILFLLYQLSSFADHCCIAGSFPLVQYVRSLTPRHPDAYRVLQNAHNNDIDVFLYNESVPYGDEVRPIDAHYPNFHLVESHCNQRGLRIRFPEEKEEVAKAKNYRYYYNTSYHSFTRIRYLLEIQLENKKGTIPTKVQLVFLQPPTDLDEMWSDFVTRKFDIDVAKGVAWVNTQLRLQLSIPRPIRLSIHRCCFNFTFRNYESFGLALLRLTKYANKGFRLNSIAFAPYHCPKYKAYIMAHFDAIYARESLKALPCGHMLIEEVIREIVSYTQVHKGKHTYGLFRSMGLRELYKYAKEHDNRDWNGNPLDTSFEGKYKIYESRVAIKVIQTWCRRYLSSKNNAF